MARGGLPKLGFHFVAFKNCVEHTKLRASDASFGGRKTDTWIVIITSGYGNSASLGDRVVFLNPRWMDDGGNPVYL